MHKVKLVLLLSLVYIKIVLSTFFTQINKRSTSIR